MFPGKSLLQIKHSQFAYSFLILHGFYHFVCCSLNILYSFPVIPYSVVPRTEHNSLGIKLSFFLGLGVIIILFR